MAHAGIDRQGRRGGCVPGAVLVSTLGVDTVVTKGASKYTTRSCQGLCEFCLAISDILQSIPWKRTADSLAPTSCRRLASYKLKSGSHLIPSYSTLRKLNPKLVNDLAIPIKYWPVPMNVNKAGACRVMREGRRDNSVLQMKMEIEDTGTKMARGEQFRLICSKKENNGDDDMVQGDGTPALEVDVEEGNNEFCGREVDQSKDSKQVEAAVQFMIQTLSPVMGPLKMWSQRRE